MYNVFETFLTNMITSKKETQNLLCDKNLWQMPKENVLPFVKGVLFMPSPPIKINTNYADAKNDSLKLLQITPESKYKIEERHNYACNFLFSSRYMLFTVTHKSLFSRYARHNPTHVPDLRTNLFVSRINIDNCVLFDNNEKQGLSKRFATPKMNRLSAKKPAEKYSRLFSTFMNKNIKGLWHFCLDCTLHFF